MIFQSTHPARGATRGHPHHRPVPDHFNPRTPRGVRPSYNIASRLLQFYFNPRTPRGVRLKGDGFSGAEGGISIHAPREGCDLCGRPSWLSSADFNPRTPRGVRRGLYIRSEAGPDFNPRTPRGVRQRYHRCAAFRWRFQSTHPARGATRAPGASPTPTTFQSTHPARGATYPGGLHRPGRRYFNPRTPRGVRPRPRAHPRAFNLISIHAPREGCDGP